MSWTIDGSPRRQRTIFLDEIEEQPAAKTAAQATVRWQDDPVWLDTVAQIMEVLDRFPEARAAMIKVWEANLAEAGR